MRIEYVMGDISSIPASERDTRGLGREAEEAKKKDSWLGILSPLGVANSLAQNYRRILEFH